MTRRKRPEVAFVLSGGGSLGAIQAGMLRALYERDIRPDMIVGTSAGALNGAFAASRPPTVATADALGDIWRDLRRGQAFPLNPLAGLLGFVGARDHLVPASGLRRLVARHMECDLLEELPVPLHVIAVDLIRGEEVRLSRGPVLEAVLASAAIPGVFSPVEMNGLSLADGGVANNTPISHAVELGAGRVYVLPTGHACALQSTPGSALGMALHAIGLLTQRRLVEDVERHREEAHLVVLPPPCPLDVQPIDFGHADELIERGYADACEFLDSGGAERPPIRMRPHSHRAPASEKRASRPRKNAAALDAKRA